MGVDYVSSRYTCKKDTQSGEGAGRDDLNQVGEEKNEPQCFCW